MRKLIPLLLISCSVPLAAQATSSFPIDNVYTTTSQNIPIAGGSIANWDEARSQFYFPSTYLPANPGVLVGVDWATTISGAIPYERFEVNVGTATGGGLTPSFANNFTNVFPAYALSMGTINWTPGWAGVTFPIPYIYDGTSSLVVEVRKQIDRPNNTTIPQATQALYIYPNRTDLPRPIWCWGTYGSGQVDGSSASTTNSTLMIMRLHWLGLPTLNIDSSRDTTGNSSRGYFHLGATVTNSVQGNPGDFFGVLLNTVLLGTPVTIPGISGEIRMLPRSVIGSGVLDAAGLGSSTLVIPSNTALIGLQAYMQGVTLGLGGSLMTNVVDMIVQPY